MQVTPKEEIKDVIENFDVEEITNTVMDAFQKLSDIAYEKLDIDLSYDLEKYMIELVYGQLKEDFEYQQEYGREDDDDEDR